MRNRKGLRQRQRRQQQQRARPSRPARRTPSARTPSAAPRRPATAPPPERRPAPASAATARWPRPTRRTGRRRRRSRPPSRRRRPCPAGRGRRQAWRCSARTGTAATPACAARCRPSAACGGPASPTAGRRSTGRAPSPASVPVSVSCATEDDTDSSSAIFGSAGRYMSMVSGPSATKAPSTTIMRTRLGATDCPSAVGDSAAVTSTSGDTAMQVVSTAYQYFLPGSSDSDRDHSRAPAAHCRSFTRR